MDYQFLLMYLRNTYEHYTQLLKANKYRKENYYKMKYYKFSICIKNFNLIINSKKYLLSSHEHEQNI